MDWPENSFFDASEWETNCSCLVFIGVPISGDDRATNKLILNPAFSQATDPNRKLKSMGAAGEEWQFVEAAKCVDTESAAQVTIGTKLPTIRPELKKCCATLAATLAQVS
jgi:hypothetical protein